ncbi:MAG: G-D-S-L family lipolytic protein [Croceitalea sp.]|nr:G-D-S-L family lipolytic protein [Croceitalea sp.]MBT8239305.1 G-D-S-L family lipolytic protein [Croceitalea sp.]NNL08068.1 G-D-S-L family lipolytic protein [Croceitalea sp.]NNM18524.1 G-D-S-L family lipolytic protein [Croceitalea sp.]
MKRLIVLTWAITSCLSAIAQVDFTEEVAEVVRRNDSIWNPKIETVVFTGSSSIRLWEDLEECFPNHQVLNTGFGGSETSDLLLHLDDLVLRYKPNKVFIYEGDNDISLGKTPRMVIMTAQEVIESIIKAQPKTEIVLISAKPSITRWGLKGKYRRLNKRLSKLADDYDYVKFVNVWDIMLEGRNLRTDIFIEDGLHLNAKGYELWYEQLKPFVR